ncbi:phosphomannomutase/phosphoglucomutase [Candidatus Parcubacteria bacterium]|jgi:phosphomannomutase|nr:phosphomannomutase/phosphoglucomutase [Candidatus Parcubacteria bacterium]MBT3949081.1 phosphomannomutase/phosphoglucomutase [Candidatus Parcubacteria bacterium]
MSFPEHVFKAYDIRGVYPGEIDENVMEKIGKAFADFVKSDKVLLGYDMRVSAPQLSKAFARGVNSQGVGVIDLGQISTDVIYFASGKYNLPGAMITASHNPAQYTGVKFCKAQAEPIGKETGIEEMREMVREDAFLKSENIGGVEENKNILEEFAQHCYGFINLEKIKSFNLVIDAGNGMAGKTVPIVFEKMPCSVTSLYFELDGNFPNHEANPIKKENNEDLIACVKEKHADLGLAFDGDGDRVFFIDENGEMVDSSLITAMVSKKVLEKNPGATIIYNVVVSKSVPELVEKMGGKLFMSKVGHSYIKQDMKDHNASFAGEHSGHYYFKDNYRADSGMIAALYVLELLSESGKKMSELVKEFEVYSKIEETNFEVQNKQIILDKFSEIYKNNITQDFDGITFEFEDYWFNVRPSNTEPVLRLNLEAKTGDIMKEKVEEIKKIIES